jgi:hypothetical protein
LVPVQVLAEAWVQVVEQALAGVKVQVAEQVLVVGLVLVVAEEQV